MVVAPCRALTAAARWNGQPAHSTTGVDRASETHSHDSNRRGGNIPSSTTGSVRAAATSRRTRRASVSADESAASAVSVSRSAPSRAGGDAGARTDAAYPAASTVARRSAALTPAGCATVALSVA